MWVQGPARKKCIGQAAVEVNCAGHLRGGVRCIAAAIKFSVIHTLPNKFLWLKKRPDKIVLVKLRLRSTALAICMAEFAVLLL